MKLLFIAVGGAVGSCLRYLLMNFAQQHTSAATTRWFGHAFPIGTLTVNVLGCLVIGGLSALFTRHLLPHEPYRLALTVGVLGGFTTFSAFGLDTFTLWATRHMGLALFNIFANCGLGLFAVWLGYFLVRYFLPASA